MKLELRKINTQDAYAEWEYTTALPEDENGLTNPFHGVSYEDYIKTVLPKQISYEHPVDMPDWFVPETFYYLWNGDCLIGEFRIRHYLTEALRNGAGHIGYSIRKEFRGQGYGTAGLKLTIEIAKDIIPEDEIYLRANKDNIASQKVMLKNGAYAAGEDEDHCFFRISKTEAWSQLTHEQKNHELYLKQKALLDQFLSTGAITKAQHDKSLHDLTEKMGEEHAGEME